MTDQAIAFLAILAAIIFIACAVRAAIALVAALVERRNHSNLGEETVREILGYGPPLWPMGPTNGRPRDDDKTPVP